MPNIKTVNSKFKCPECQNDVDAGTTQKTVKDVVECPFCGIEYEIVNVDKVDENHFEYELQELKDSK